MERLDNSKLSPIQKHIVNEISKERCTVIVGGPGTGKTVLAMSGMQKGSGRRQMLLTYSKPLSEMIKGCGIEANTIHSFCWQLGKAIELQLRQFAAEYKNDEDENRRAFNNVINREYGYKKPGEWPQWDRLYNDFIKLSPDKQRELRYDDIFIDEGQDLPDDAYRFLKEIADRIVVTYDEAQEVGRDSAENENTMIRKAGIECNRIIRTLGLQESFYDLIDNFRNTLAIERVAKLFYNNYGNNAFSLHITKNREEEGKLPEVIFSDATQDIIDRIADEAYQLNKQIGIIIFDQEDFDKVKEMMERAILDNYITKEKFFYKYGKIDNMGWGNNANLNQTGVFLMTFQSSKGMEFDDVHIFGCQKIHLTRDDEKNKFYVAVTRAKKSITFYFNCNRSDRYPVLEVVENNKNLFRIEG